MTLRKFWVLYILFLGLAVTWGTYHAKAGTADVDAETSCYNNYANGSVDISVWGDKTEGESYSGTGETEAHCEYVDRYDNGSISVTVVRKNFFGYEWLSEDKVSRSATAYIVGWGAYYMGSSSAKAKGSGGGDLDLSECP